MRLKQSVTEKSAEQWSGLDKWDAKRLSVELLSSHLEAVTCVSSAAEQLAEVGERIVERLLAGSGRLVFCGAGSAGAQACLDGMELPATFGWPRRRLALLLAGGFESFFDQGGLREDDTGLARDDIQALELCEEDVLIAVSASGNTPYTIAAVEHANNRGALSLAMVNNVNSRMQASATLSLVFETGPEVIAGSTRMAAATAQKIALNALSTMVMTRMGFVYDNLMVNMCVSNKKLQARAVAMICQISGCEVRLAKLCLAQSGQEIPLAVLLAQGQPLELARNKLEKSGGRLRLAMNCEE